MTTPIKPGTRFDIPTPGKNDDELKQLDDLINFLGGVKDTARLRAKNESGVKFLHTRTGTPLGRFWKWLTVGWPEAQRQRIRFKESVRDILKTISPGDDAAIFLLKQKILHSTLKVKVFEEFDVRQLRSDLDELKNLVINRQLASLASVDKQQSSSIVEVDSEAQPIDLETGELPEKMPVRSGVETDITQPKPPKPQKPPKEWKPSNREVLFKELDEFSSLMDKPIRLDEKTGPLSPSKPSAVPEKSAEEWRPADPDTFFKLKEFDEISAQLDAPIQVDEKKEESTTKSASAPANTRDEVKFPALNPGAATLPAEPVEENYFSFNCKVINQALSASTEPPGYYKADCYILPTTGQDLQFKHGTTQFDQGRGIANGVRVFGGTHTYHDEKRSLKKIQLSPILEQDQGLLKTLNEKDQQQYLSQLRQRYENALDEAFQGGAKTLSIQALGSTLITPPEIQVLKSSIAKFQTQHPEVRIHVTFTGPSAVRTFNALPAAS